MSYFYTLLISMTPVLELRASIPLAILHYKLSYLEAIVISCLGGILVTALILIFLPYVVTFTRKHLPSCGRLIDKILAHTQKKHGQRLTVLGEISLIILVALPLPGSGAFTGSLLAYVFGIPFRTALLLISIGVIISGGLVGLITLSGESLWSWFF